MVVSAVSQENQEWKQWKQNQRYWSTTKMGQRAARSHLRQQTKSDKKYLRSLFWLRHSHFIRTRIEKYVTSCVYVNKEWKCLIVHMSKWEDTVVG